MKYRIRIHGSLDTMDYRGIFMYLIEDIYLEIPTKINIINELIEKLKKQFKNGRMFKSNGILKDALITIYHNEDMIKIIEIKQFYQKIVF